MRYDLGRVEIRRRNGLPHWGAQYGIYFVTFNLFDAIPWDVEKQIRQKAHERLRHVQTIAERQAVEQWVQEELGRSLDRTYGSCFMRDSRIARIVADAITYFDQERYSLLAWCVMPNHVHVVMENVRDLRKVVNSWKSFTATKANALLGRVGTFWNADYYDRCIRDSRERRNTIEYVLRNPEAAGLHGWEWVRAYPERLK